VTPFDPPGRRPSDGPDDPERVTGSGAAAPLERSLWDKADLLDPPASSNQRPAERRPDSEAHLQTRPGPAESTLWRKAELLDARPAPPARTADGPATPDGQRARDAPREARADRFRFPIHEQKSNEILERERPLVDRVAHAAKKILDSRATREWDELCGQVRNKAIIGVVDAIRTAMELPPIRVRTKDEPGLCGSHEYRRGVHRIEISNDMSMELTVATAVHEVRHAYQTEVVEGRKPNHPDADGWDRNKQWYSDLDQTDIERYFSQPIEADSFGFERAIGKILGTDWPDI